MAGVLPKAAVYQPDDSGQIGQYGDTRIASIADLSGQINSVAGSLPPEPYECSPGYLEHEYVLRWPSHVIPAPFSRINPSASWIEQKHDEKPRSYSP